MKFIFYINKEVDLTTLWASLSSVFLMEEKEVQEEEGVQFYILDTGLYSLKFSCLLL